MVNSTAVSNFYQFAFLDLDVNNDTQDFSPKEQFTDLAVLRMDGWIAAKELGIPKCTRLIPVGETAQMQTCSPQTVEVTSLKTTCGMQPLVHDNYTISVNGFGHMKLKPRSNILN
jgi:hypothetical protein